MITGRVLFRPASARLGLRAPCLGRLRTRPIVRCESTTGAVGSEKTGHIDAEPNESVLFFDSMYYVLRPYPHLRERLPAGSDCSL